MRLYTLGMIGTDTIILINFIVLNYVIQKVSLVHNKKPYKRENLF